MEGSKDMGGIFKINANSYYLAYKCLMDKNRELCEFYNDRTSVYFFPAISLATFSCELALKHKILQTKEHATFKGRRGHDLEYLFKSLDINQKQEIIERTVELYNLKTDLYNKTDLIYEVNFYSILKENKDVFVDFRYIYDNQILYTANIDYIEALMFCLNDVSEDYESYLKRSRL